MIKSRIAGAVWLVVSASACSAALEDEAELGTAALGLAVAPLQAGGYLSTSFGNALTNRCAVDVQSAFASLPEAPSGKIRYRSMGGKVLPPMNAKLANFGGWDSHVQSIARLSLPWADNVWAAVSRANPGTNGGAGFFLAAMAGVRGADGTRWVLPGDNFTGEPPSNRRTYLYYPISGTGHPGGIQAVGDFLIVASEGLEQAPPFVDFFQRVPSDIAYEPLQRFTLYGDLGEPVAPSRFITAVGMTRLRGGRYLLFVLGKDEEQQGWFYLSDQTSLDAATSWGFLGYVAMPWLYQNVSLITECSTRNIYLLATNNVDYDGGANSGTEYGDLMQVSWDAASAQVNLQLLAIRAFDAGGSGYCTFRAAANAFVDKDGKLTLYCHSYKANTDIFGSPDSKLKLVEYAAP